MAVQPARKIARLAGVGCGPAVRLEDVAAEAGPGTARVAADPGRGGRRGVLLAVAGYVLGTYAGLACMMMLKWIAHGGL